jgi:FkbM family methyltransferase
MPFYNRSVDVAEIAVISEWCRAEPAPTIIDVGANTGFLTSQVLQLLTGVQVRAFCFEPVPETFRKLLGTVELLKLKGRMIPVPAALSDAVGLAEMAYDNWDSMFAQVVHSGTTDRVGRERAWCPTLTVDLVSRAIGQTPTVLKIDVEGSELDVLKGARETLTRADPPALCMEYNPLTLSECGVSPEQVLGMLTRYRLFFIDDFGHDSHDFGAEISDVATLGVVTNLFCVPNHSAALQRWESVREQVARRLELPKWDRTPVQRPLMPAPTAPQIEVRTHS